MQSFAAATISYKTGKGEDLPCFTSTNRILSPFPCSVNSVGLPSTAWGQRTSVQASRGGFRVLPVDDVSASLRLRFDNK